MPDIEQVDPQAAQVETAAKTAADQAYFTKLMADAPAPEGKIAGKLESTSSKAPAKPAIAPATGRDDGGKFVPKAQAAPAQAAVQDQDDEADETAFETAKAALRAKGFRKNHFDAMDRDEILKRGAKAIKSNEADAEAHRLAKEYRDALARGKTAEKETGAPNKPEILKPLDLKPITGKLAKTLVLDEEGASTLNEAFQEFSKLHSEQVVAPLRAEIDALKAEHASQAQASEANLITSAQAEIGKRFPDLLDPDTFAEVLNVVGIMGNSPKYKGSRYATAQARVNACFEDACKHLELSTEESAQPSPSEDPERDLRRNGRSTVSDRTRPTPTTQREKDWEVFTGLMDK